MPSRPHLGQTGRMIPRASHVIRPAAKNIMPTSKTTTPSENMEILIVIYIEDRLVVKFFSFVKLYG